MVSMQSFVVRRGAVDQSIDIFIVDSATYAGKTGLLYSAGACFYRRGPVGAVTPFSLSSGMTATGPHVDGGFVELQSVNMPGLYRLGLYDAVAAAGVDVVEMVLTFSGALPVRVHLDLVDYDPYAATTTPASIAETLLKYDVSTLTGEASRSILNAIRILRNKWAIANNVLTVTKEDDSTTAWTADLTTVANADSIVSSDPT